MKLLLTSVYHKVGNDPLNTPYSFFVLDPVTKRITNSVPYSPELDSAPTDGRPQPFGKWGKPGSSHIPDEDRALKFLPFGITSGEGKIFVASNYNIAAFDKDTYEYIETISTSGVPHVHEITYNDGYIFRTNTSNDTISRINVSTKEEIHFSFKTMDREETLTYPSDTRNLMDVIHLNAVTVDGDNVYVLAHNRYQKRSEVFVMDKDLTSATKLVDLDYAQHDIIIHNGKLFSFGSQRGVLTIVDLDTLRVIKRFITDSDTYFLRGGVILNGEILVFANAKGSTTFEPFHGPGEFMINAKILTVDLETYLVTSQQDTDEFGTIADLVILP
jgi:DNA-binding beta-propeller fold protein YncE